MTIAHPQVLAKIRRWQGELAFQSVASDRDAAQRAQDFAQAYQLTLRMVSERNEFSLPDKLQQYLDQVELAEAAERAELWDDAVKHREVNIRLAVESTLPFQDLVTDSKLDLEVTIKLSRVTPSLRAAYWEAKKLSKYSVLGNLSSQSTTERLVRVAETMKSCFGMQSREYGLAALALGDSYAKDGSTELARKVYRTAYSVLSKCLGEGHRSTISAKSKMTR